MYLYHEPIKGDVYKYKIIDQTDDIVVLSSELHKDRFHRIPNKKYPDGSFFLNGVGSFYPESDDWRIKYQNSLSLRVAQGQLRVYYVNSMKKGKINTRALVLGDNGSAYSTFIPTIPTPRLGQCYMKLRMDLEVISLLPVMDLYERVMKARESDPSL